MQSSELVVKSNRLVEASYRLTLNEQRIILYAICRTREEDVALAPDKPVTITADTFAKQFPSVGKGNVYQQLKDAMDALYDRSVTINDKDPETGHDRVTKTRWISTASYIDGAGHVQVIFAPQVIRYIARVEEEFTKYQLEKVSEMTSFHAIRIYELLSQYRATKSRSITLVELRNYLQIESGEYKLTANFMRKVLDVAVKQINDFSDLNINYVPTKTSRAITAFAFKIREKKPLAPDQAYREKLEEQGGQMRIDAKKEAEEEF